LHHPLIHKKAWVFDLDGTLTIAVHDFAHMRAALGMAPDADILATIAAAPRTEKAALTVQLDELEAYYASHASAAQGVRLLIPLLAEKGCKLGIFTRNNKQMALLSLKAIGLEEYFDPAFIIGRDDAPHKPHPAGLIHLLKSWRIDANDAVMVGDFKYDLETGRAAKVATVHVATDERRWPELTDFCYQSLGQIHIELS